VDSLPLTPQETLAAVRACAYVRLPRMMGDYFREFLALGLEDESEATAAKVRAMSDNALRSLYDYIVGCQALAE